MDNQKKQSQHLSRDEFEKYASNLSIDEAVMLLPKKVKNKKLSLRYDLGIYYVSYGDNIKEYSPDHRLAVIKMLLWLYDNKDISQYYVTPKQVG